MSAHVCGCDPEHVPTHHCEHFPACAFGRTFITPGTGLEKPIYDGNIAEEAVARHIRIHPVVSPILRKAWQLTHGDRRAAYGTPAEVFAGYAKIWSGLLAGKLTRDLDATDVLLCMVGLKLAREANNTADDNRVDAHGYLILLEEVLESLADTNGNT